jgi:uncharacterized protein (DUF362 family)
MVLTKSRVSIVKGQNVGQMLQETFETLNCDNLVEPGERVLVKPNCISPKPPGSGVTTDLRIIEVAVNKVQELKGDALIGDGGWGDTDRAFEAVGLKDLADRMGVDLIDLNEDERVKIKIPKSTALQEAGIAKTVLDVDAIINVPKLKVHHLALVTLSMKNLMGCMLPKSIMHTRINEKIVDLASIFKDKVVLNIIDGTVGSEVDEVHGEPVEMNLVIAGRDMVAVDAVGASVMGIDPSDVRYLGLADQRGLGRSRLSDIEIVGERIEDVQKRFERPKGF